MHMTIARQRLGKNIPEVKLSTVEGYPLLGNEPINKLLQQYATRMNDVFYVVRAEIVC
jgi:hypothetical protein